MAQGFRGQGPLCSIRGAQWPKGLGPDPVLRGLGQGWSGIGAGAEYPLVAYALIATRWLLTRWLLPAGCYPLVAYALIAYALVAYALIATRWLLTRWLASLG